MKILTCYSCLKTAFGISLRQNILQSFPIAISATWKRFAHDENLTPLSVTLGGAVFERFGIQVHNGFATVRWMKYTSQHCCDKAMDERMASYREQCDNSNMTKDLFGIGFDVLFSELYKIMVNKITFVGFRGGNRPLLDLPLPLLCVPKFTPSTSVQCIQSKFHHRFYNQSKIRVNIY